MSAGTVRLPVVELDEDCLVHVRRDVAHDGGRRSLAHHARLLDERLAAGDLTGAGRSLAFVCLYARKLGVDGAR